LADGILEIMRGSVHATIISRDAPDRPAPAMTRAASGESGCTRR
jgi:hypothetical protein